MAHAYYNLPFLIPVCWAFGQAMNCDFWRFRPVARGWMVAGVMAVTLPMTAYLLRPDPILAETTKWMKENINKGDLVIIKANHSVYTREYPQNPGFSYLSGRRTWIWSPYLSDEERTRALKTSGWLVETVPPSETSWWENVRKKIKGHERPVEEISELKKTVWAEMIKQGEGYQAFRINLKR